MFGVTSSRPQLSKQMVKSTGRRNSILHDLPPVLKKARAACLSNVTVRVTLAACNMLLVCLSMDIEKLELYYCLSQLAMYVVCMMFFWWKLLTKCTVKPQT